MTAFTFGQAAASALGGALGTAGRRAHTEAGTPPRTPHRLPHRTGAPVLRGSVEAGSFEHLFFAVPARGETDRLLRTARAALDAGRRVKRAARIENRPLTAAERALAGLSAGAVRVFEELCTLARLNAGRVYPSYDHLAAATALGRATVARGIAALEAAGFLVRQRRFRRVEGEGPRYRQTSNAYRPVLPARLLGLLPRWCRPAPLPDDEVQRGADRAEAIAAMHAQLSCRELAQATLGGPLGRVLARLGAALDAREPSPQSPPDCESHHDLQPLPESIYSSVTQRRPGRPTPLA